MLEQPGMSERLGCCLRESYLLANAVSGGTLTTPTRCTDRDPVRRAGRRRGRARPACESQRALGEAATGDEQHLLSPYEPLAAEVYYHSALLAHSCLEVERRDPSSPSYARSERAPVHFARTA